MASYLGATLLDLVDWESCIDYRELWRGALVIREKKVGTVNSFYIICLISVFFNLEKQYKNWRKKMKYPIQCIEAQECNNISFC